MTDRHYLSVFTPSRTPPADLEAIHVQRQAMLQDAVERVRESATSGNKHHLLFIGPRGTGKTHLITLLVHRLGLETDLDGQLRIAWLNEDETSTTLLELLRRIYDALGKRYPREYPAEALEPIFDLAPGEAERQLAGLLLEALAHRTLLVVVENLDALFEGLGTAGQQKLRAFIQEHPVLTLVATAQRLSDAVAKRSNAFFGFFQTEQLKALSMEQAGELLRKIATLNQQPEVAAFLATATGRSRIRALHHLSGGNHRIYIVLSQFITRDSISALFGPFAKMIDEMTPYYQERIRWLPPQQRKIVEYLCGCERPSPVKDMARRLFASQQTVSSQLKDLRSKGYVQAGRRGRESLYEIAEPLMRLCVEVKENQSHAPLRVLVDFLRVWYDGRELSSRLRACDAASTTRAYLEDAIEQNRARGNLRAQLLVQGYRAELGDEQVAEWGPRIETYAAESEELALACGEWAKGNPEEALAILDELTNSESEQPSRIKASAWMLAGEIYYRQESLESAIGCLDSLLALPQAPVERIARALINRGVTYERLGDTDKAIIDYSAVIDLPQAPVERIARALYSRGWTYGQLGDIDKAKRDFKAVAGLDNVSTEIGVDCGLALAEIGIATGAWNTGLAALDQALAQGAGLGADQGAAQDLPEENNPPPSTSGRYAGNSMGIIGAFFNSGVTPAVQRKRSQELMAVYQHNNAIPDLGEALTQHLGMLYDQADDRPASDTLEAWASAWESVGTDIATFRLPLRLLRTGIDFLKSGGEDRGILLTLNQEERQILEQTFGLDSA